MHMLNKLFKPLNYLKIKHNEKYWFDLILPVIFSLLASGLFYCLPNPVNFVGNGGVISLVNGIFQILSGFYIASMAAVATFQKEGMDNVMEGDPPTLTVNNSSKKLTRRVFLTYLFGYLAFMSIFVYFIGGFIQLASASVSILFSDIPLLVKYLFIWIYMFMVFNVLCTTLLGMHFMIDKIHRPKKNIIDKNKDNTPPT